MAVFRSTSARLSVIGVALAAVVGLVVTGPATAASSGDELLPTAGSVRQIATLEYLISPDYAGVAPLRRILTPQASDESRRSIQGLGTLNDLAGELVIFKGVPYRVPVSGTPQRVPDARTTPFAQAIAFSPQASQVVPPNTTCAQLPEIIDDLAGTDSGMVAVRVSGVMRELITRSVPRQTIPYPPLADVIAEQTEFDLGQPRAVLVGFRQGADLAGLGAAGLHLHGLTTDLTGGGHVLSCRIGKAHIAIQRVIDVVVYGSDE